VILHFVDESCASSLTADTISAGSGVGSSTASPSIELSAVSDSGTTAPARRSPTAVADELEARDLVGRIDAVAEISPCAGNPQRRCHMYSCSRRRPVKAHDFADVKRAAKVGHRGRRVDGSQLRFGAAARCFDQDAHGRRSCSNRVMSVSL
jgi:hypothetical protein